MFISLQVTDVGAALADDWCNGCKGFGLRRFPALSIFMVVSHPPPCVAGIHDDANVFVPDGELFSSVELDHDVYHGGYGIGFTHIDIRGVTLN